MSWHRDLVISLEGCIPCSIYCDCCRTSIFRCLSDMRCYYIPESMSYPHFTRAKYFICDDCYQSSDDYLGQGTCSDCKASHKWQEYKECKEAFLEMANILLGSPEGMLYDLLMIIRDYFIPCDIDGLMYSDLEESCKLLRSAWAITRLPIITIEQNDKPK
jgi:hypothetical protein